MGDFQPWHIIVILVVLFLLFGAKKMPDMARSVGQSLRIFKSEMRQSQKETEEVAKQANDAARVTPAVEKLPPLPPRSATRPSRSRTAPADGPRRPCRPASLEVLQGLPRVRERPFSAALEAFLARAAAVPVRVRGYWPGRVFWNAPCAAEVSQSFWLSSLRRSA